MNKYIRVHFDVTILFTIRAPSIMLYLDIMLSLSKGASIITIAT